MYDLQLTIDALECLKRKLGREYDKFPDIVIKNRYNYCERSIQRIMHLNPQLTRKSKEYYL